MIPAKRLIHEVIRSLREVIAPSIAEPYPKSQAYMAAVILEFVAQQVEERSDLAAGKHAVLTELFDELGAFLKDGDDRDAERRLCDVIENLYRDRERLGEEAFTIANNRIRQALRQLLDLDLKVAAKKGD